MRFQIDLVIYDHTFGHVYPISSFLYAINNRPQELLQEAVPVASLYYPSVHCVGLHYTTARIDVALRQDVSGGCATSS